MKRFDPMNPGDCIEVLDFIHGLLFEEDMVEKMEDWVPPENAKVEEVQDTLGKAIGYLESIGWPCQDD